jgi:hypothetical protein
MIPNRYKIDCHHDYDRIDRPFGVFVQAGLLRRWKHICSFASDAEAQAYIAGILSLPREIYQERH